MKFVIIFFVVCFLGCSVSNSKGNVVISVKKFGNVCEYMIDNFGINQTVYAPCGCFNVGDTLVYKRIKTAAEQEAVNNNNQQPKAEHFE